MRLRWWFTDEDALPFPYEHAFLSGHYLYPQETQTDNVIGEISDRRRFYIGKRLAGIDGGPIRGLPEWFRGGLPAGLPPCPPTEADIVTAAIAGAIARLDLAPRGGAAGAVAALGLSAVERPALVQAREGHGLDRLASARPGTAGALDMQQQAGWGAPLAADGSGPEAVPAVEETAEEIPLTANAGSTTCAGASEITPGVWYLTAFGENQTKWWVLPIVDGATYRFWIQGRPSDSATLQIRSYPACPGTLLDIVTDFTPVQYEFLSPADGAVRFTLTHGNFNGRFAWRVEEILP